MSRAGALAKGKETSILDREHSHSENPRKTHVAYHYHFSSSDYSVFDDPEIHS